MKKRLLGLLLVLVMVCGICLTACQDNSEILSTVVFEKDGQAVSSEFTLKAEVGGKKVTWTSDNAAITLEKSEDGSVYVAKINPPEDSQVVVTLTVSLGKASKSFTVKVNPITVDDIADEYIFAKKGTMVTNSFDLDTSTTYAGKTAQITWSVKKDADKDYIEVVGNKCVVTPSSLNPEVEITGSFTYKGETVIRNYKFTVSIEMSHLEEIDYWYNNTNVGRDLKGYVVAIAESYPKYNKFISFYLMDEELNAGYYIYRLDIGENNKAVADKIVPGVYMEISGKVNTVYNGLYETTGASGATWTIDDTKTIKLEDHIYALDNDVLAGSPAERRHTGTLVSLTNWTVKSVAETPDTDGKVAALLLEKGGKTVAVSTSKYMASYYAYDESAKNFDTTGQAIANLCKTYKAGDVVSVTGILSYYDDGKAASTNGIQILPRKADDVKSGTADAAGTVYDGTKVGAAITALNNAIKENGLNGIVVADDEVTLPAEVEGATLTYKLCSSSNAVVLAGSKFTITPNKNEKVNVQVDIKHGSYTTNLFFAITSNKMSDADIVAAEKVALKLTEEIKNVGDTDLRTIGATFTTATIAWEIVGETALATIEGGKLKVAALPETDTQITVKATITNGQASDTRAFKVTIKAAPKITITKVDVTKLEEGKAYKIVMNQEQSGDTLFAVGKFSGYYLASTTDYQDAGEFYIQKVEGGVKIYFLNGQNKVYIGVTRSGTYNNVNIGGKVGAASSGTSSKDPGENDKTYDVWTIAADGMTIKIDDTTSVCLGTQTGKTYNTFSFRNGATASAASVYPAYFAEVTEG